MGLKDIGSKLPPGFRFHPSDEELVCHYLCNKIRAKSDHGDIEDDEVDEALKDATDLVEIDLHICEPWQLPDVAKLNAKEWYFFSFRDRKYATGYRTNRATISGYWKATGKDRTVMDPRTRQLVGMRKTLVFYRNRAPNGIKTTWIMHEFRLECPNIPPKCMYICTYMNAWLCMAVAHDEMAASTKNDKYMQKKTKNKWKKETKVALMRISSFACTRPHEDWVLCRVFNKGRDSSLQDNNYNNDHQIQRLEIIGAPDLSYASNYNNQLPPLLSSPPHHQQKEKMKFQVCDQWEQLTKQPSRTDHPYHQHCHHRTVACGWEQMIIGSLSTSSSYGPDHESLLNLLYVDNNNSVNITDDHHQNYEKILLSPDMTSLEHDKTCMGSSSDGGMVSDLYMDCGGLSFETDDNLLPFH